MLRWLVAATASIAIVAVAAAPARAAWVVDETGECRRIWTPASLYAGPRIMLDSPLVPIRFVVGGVAQAIECPDTECNGLEKTGLGAAGVLIGATFGTFEGFMDVTLGFADFSFAG